MSVVFALLALAVVGAGVIVALKRPDAAVLSDPIHDRAVGSLPEGPLQAEDLRRVRFPVAFRGYRMQDVDALLSRLENQLEAPAATAVPVAPNVPAPDVPGSSAAEVFAAPGQVAQERAQPPLGPGPTSNPNPTP